MISANLVDDERTKLAESGSINRDFAAIGTERCARILEFEKQYLCNIVVRFDEASQQGDDDITVFFVLDQANLEARDSGFL